MQEKRFFLSFLVLMAGMILYPLNGQENDNNVVLRIDNKPVYKQDFIRIYKKNEGAVEEKEPVKDYLDKFINYKLKVLEAQNMGLDSQPSFQKEFNNYRDQLAEPYSFKNNLKESLLRQDFQNSQYDVRAKHILIKLPPNASPEDTAKTYNKLAEARKRIKNGESFEKIAREMSEDPAVKRNGGDLGYFNLFRFPYPFEKAVYSLKEGQLSQPIQTNYGYHLIYLVDKRPARGEIKVAHILKMAGNDTTEENWNKIHQQIDTIYQKIQEGADFAEMAKKYSDDKRTGKNGGTLPWFGTGRMIPKFENAAFKLNKKGEISEPVKTSLGYHLIKLIDKRKLDSFEDFAEKRKEVFDKGSRKQYLNKLYIQKLHEKLDVRENDQALQTILNQADSSFFVNAPAQKEVIFVCNGNQYKQNDLIKYLKDQRDFERRLKRNGFSDNYLKKQYQAFKEEILKEEELNYIKANYPKYRNLVQEYYEGMLLFELMEKEVWDKARKDTLGLKQYYQDHKSNYQWDTRAKTKIYICSDKKTAKQIKKTAKKAFRHDTLEMEEVGDYANMKTEDSISFTINHGVFEKNENKLLDQVNWKPGKIQIKEDQDNYHVFIIEDILDPEPKTLSEARGHVIADYQDHLEQELLNELRNKYSFTVNEQALNDIE